MIFLLYTGTSALIIYISNIQGTKKYSAVMYYLVTHSVLVARVTLATLVTLVNLVALVTLATLITL